MADQESGAPVHRVAMEPLLAEVNRRTDSGLRLRSRADHGEQGGAAYVVWPDGRQGVLTCAAAPLETLRQTSDVLAAARAAGLPVPCHDLVVPLDDGRTAVVQERLPGEPARHADAAVIDGVVEMNDRFAKLLAERPDVPVPRLYLRNSGPAYWRHETLERYNDRSRTLLRRIRDIGAGEPHEMVGNDLLHRDYTLGNVLFGSNGRVTGVVDWNEGAFRGDRRFALVGLLFDLSFSVLLERADGAAHGIEQSAVDRLSEILDDALDPTTLLRYWAHFTLKGLDLTISHHPAETIDVFLRVGESRLC